MRAVMHSGSTDLGKGGEGCFWGGGGAGGYKTQPTSSSRKLKRLHRATASLRWASRIPSTSTWQSHTHLGFFLRVLLRVDLLAEGRLACWQQTCFLTADLLAQPVHGRRIFCLYCCLDQQWDAMHSRAITVTAQLAKTCCLLKFWLEFACWLGSGF